MVPEIAAALIGGAASLAGAGISAGSTAMANRRSYKWSKKYFDYQNEQNLALYSPAQQMQRMAEAGLNPHLVTGAQNGAVGSMPTGAYQNPVDGNALPNALLTAWQLYQQKQQQDNQNTQTQSDVQLKRASADKAEAEAAKTKYYNSVIQPWEAVSAEHKSNILKYNVGKAELENQKLLQDISLFSLKKQKYQTALDLLEIEKQYADEYYKWRNESVKSDASIKSSEAGIRGLDLHNYQTYGLRPQDPYYYRLGTNAIENLSEGTKFGKFLRKIFH